MNHRINVSESKFQIKFVDNSQKNEANIFESEMHSNREIPIICPMSSPKVEPLGIPTSTVNPRAHAITDEITSQNDSANDSHLTGDNSFNSQNDIQSQNDFISGADNLTENPHIQPQLLPHVNQGNLNDPNTASTHETINAPDVNGNQGTALLSTTPTNSEIAPFEKASRYYGTAIVGNLFKVTLEMNNADVLNHLELSATNQNQELIGILFIQFIFKKYLNLIFRIESDQRISTSIHRINTQK